MTFKRRPIFSKDKKLPSADAPASVDCGPVSSSSASSSLEKQPPPVEQSEFLTPDDYPAAMPSRFLRMTQAAQSSLKSSESSKPVVAETSSSSASDEAHWKAWAILEEGETLGQWEVRSCPKCHEKSLVSLHGGDFICLSCSFHGNVFTPPRQYRGRWVSVLENYLRSSLDKNPPEGLESTIGCYAYAFTGPKTELKKAWYAFAEDDAGHIRDCHILLSPPKEGHAPLWSRLDLPGYPIGLKDVRPGRLVITADLFDAVAAEKSGIENILVLPPDLDKDLPSSSAWKVMEFMEQALESAAEIVLCLPLSQKGRDNEEELGRRLDKEKCFRVRFSPPHYDSVHDGEENLLPEEKNLWSFYKKYGSGDVATIIDTASPFPVAGLHELVDINDQFDELYETGLVPGATTGWPSMDMRYTIKTGQWSVVTGIPGHGKSSWLDGLLVNLASIHGWRFGVFSPENQPIERHFASLMEKKLQKPFSEGPTPRITQSEKNKTKRWLNDKFKVILPNDDGLWTLDSVLRLAKILVYRYGIRGLVIDPWNELDHSVRNNITETTYISESLTKIRRFARLYDIHIWIVAHPTKMEKRADGKYPVATPYDISGGAHWRNKADNAISVYRNIDEQDDDITDVYVQKIRFKEVGSIGMVSLRSDRASGAYIDDIDQNKRAMALEKGTYLPSSSLRIAAPRKPPSGPPLEYEDHF